MKTIYYTPGGGSLRAPSKKLLKCRPHREVQRQNGWTLVSFLYLALVLMVFGCNDNGDSTSSDTSTNSTTGSDSMSPVASDSDTASENSLPADTATYVAVPAGELRIASEAAGKYIGAAVDAEMLRTDTDYTTVLAREFNAVTPENETKWGSLAPYSNKRDYSGADEIVHHAKAYAQRIKGHTLIWHQQTPQWLKSSVSADELNALIKEHIEQTMTRYKGHIAAWDVVNEAVDTRTASGYTESIFYNVLGPGYIAQAFHLARAADPDALLYYNEVGIERMGPKADFTYELMKNLLAEGVPIDGIGFQAHLLMNRYPSVSNMRENFKRFADLGLRVNISELDARTSWMQGTHDQRMFAERIAFQSVVGACLNEPGCEGITFWGFTNWIIIFQSDQSQSTGLRTEIHRIGEINHRRMVIP